MTDARKLVVTENISTSGVIEFLDPWSDPDDQDIDDQLEVVRTHMTKSLPFRVVLQTYERR